MVNDSDSIVLNVPDMGGAEQVDVIEIAVKPGDVIQPDDLLLTLEGEKATMEVPATHGGVVKTVHVQVGDKVSAGSPILLLEIPVVSEQSTASSASASPAPASPAPASAASPIYASPAVRRIARESDIDLTKIVGTGQKGRIAKIDLQQYVQPESSINHVDMVDKIAHMDKWGATEIKALSKIQKISGAHLHRNWTSIPHVTQFGEADITELEAFKQQEKKRADTHGVRLTPLVFIMKAVVATLQTFPHFNASLDASGEQLILKKYFHIGVAVDTPNGLVVPVIRDVDKKGIFTLARELAEISTKAREKGLSMTDMQGGCFSISSLGGIGGTAFTPIINAPEVAILGVSRAAMKPVYTNNQFVPRLMLPLSLSYDHRVIDGADGARFLMSLIEHLSDIRTLLF